MPPHLSERTTSALSDAESGFDDAGEQVEEFGKQLDEVGKVSEDAEGKLGKIGTVAADVGKALATAVAAIGTAAVAAGKQLWDMANDVASAGDAIDKTSQKIGKRRSISGMEICFQAQRRGCEQSPNRHEEAGYSRHGRRGRL